MSGILEKIVRFARQTTQPYQMQVRTIAVLNLVILLLWVALFFARMEMAAPECPPQVLRLNGQAISLLRACPQPLFQTFISSIIDNLAAGLIVVSVSSFIVWFVSPRRQIEDDLASLPSWNIGEVLEAPLAETKNYWFRGRSGRFMRSTVMPALYKAARRDAQRRKLSMLLPDPADITNLEAYARYRNSLSSERKRSWTAERIQIEIISTILLAAYFSGQNIFFRARVFLKSDFALFRIDMSDDRLVMTREDPAWPAILCSARSKFYASFHEEFRIEAENGARLDLLRADVPVGYDETHINPALAALGISVTLTPAQCKVVVDGMRKPRRPYA